MADPAQNFTDMFKKFGEQLKVQPFDMTKIMESHQKNLEAMTKSWQAMAEGAMNVARLLVEARDATRAGEPARRIARRHLARRRGQHNRGRLLAYAAMVGPETPGLFVLDTRGGSPRPRGPTNSAEPVWAPDGRSLLFTSWQDGNAEVYSMDAGGGSVRRLTTNPAADGGANW